MTVSAKQPSNGQATNGKTLAAGTPLTEADLYDLMNGAAILGAGGGGSLSEGKHYLRLAVEAGPSRLVSLSDVSDDAIVAFPYLLGAVTEPELSATPPIQLALQHLADTGAQPAALGAVELGASNVMIAAYAAAVAGLPLLDADATGRAVPEVTHSAFAIRDVPMGRVVAASAEGELFDLRDIASDARAETLLRALATACGNDISVVDRPLPLAKVRAGLLPGTLTSALAAGRAWRTAREGGESAAEAVADTLGGRVVFRGNIKRGSGCDADGFTEGCVELEGSCVGGVGGVGDKSEAEEKTELRVSFKNENMAAVLGDGRVLATVPEVITLFRENGDLVLNPEFCEGAIVTVVVLPAPAVFLSERGLALFGPTYAGVKAAFKSALQTKKEA